MRAIEKSQTVKIHFYCEPENVRNLGAPIIISPTVYGI